MMDGEDLQQILCKLMKFNYNIMKNKDFFINKKQYIRGNK